MATIHGRGGMVYLQGSGANATKLGECRSWRIDIDAEYEENTEFADPASAEDAPWVQKDVVALRWGGRVEGNLDTVETSPFDAVKARATKKLYLYPVASSTSRYYYGTIWPRLSVEVGVSGIARFDLEFDGNGEIGSN